MGKGKQAHQRTKNNSRPSNSSRSAEFLGSTAQNLVGFSALKDSGRLCLKMYNFFYKNIIFSILIYLMYLNLTELTLINPNIVVTFWSGRMHLFSFF